MTTKSKQKGSAAERDVVKYLKRIGYTQVERRLAGDVNDRGDIAGIKDLCIEVKNHARMELGQWVEELIVEVENAKAKTGAVVHKRKGKGNAKDWYATMPVWLWVELIQMAGFLPDKKTSTR